MVVLVGQGVGGGILHQPVDVIVDRALADGATGSVPAGATIDPATGVFTWTPTETDGPGSYVFDVVVTDSGKGIAPEELATIFDPFRQAGDPQGLKIRTKLFEHDAERALANALDNAHNKVQPLLATRSYADVLNSLADLREPVDLFFDEVMVMVDDEATKNNRLALLGELRALFLDVADISRLSLG